jgi:hypothetical protein
VNDRAKILDFGLAEIERARPAGGSARPRAVDATAGLSLAC